MYNVLIKDGEEVQFPTARGHFQSARSVRVTLKGVLVFEVQGQAVTYVGDEPGLYPLVKASNFPVGSLVQTRFQSYGNGSRDSGWVIAGIIVSQFKWSKDSYKFWKRSSGKYVKNNLPVCYREDKELFQNKNLHRKVGTDPLIYARAVRSGKAKAIRNNRAANIAALKKCALRNTRERIYG